jgi:hypothetical protein
LFSIAARIPKNSATLPDAATNSIR